MNLMVGITEPHLCQQPIIFRIVRSPYWVGVARLLEQLNGNRHQVSGALDVKEPQGVCCVSGLSFPSGESNAFKLLVIYNVDVAFLLHKGDSKTRISSRRGRKG